MGHNIAWNNDDDDDIDWHAFSCFFLRQKQDDLSNSRPNPTWLNKLKSHECHSATYKTNWLGKSTLTGVFDYDSAVGTAAD